MTGWGRHDKDAHLPWPITGKTEVEDSDKTWPMKQFKNAGKSNIYQ
jgi:hypothetical protein